MRSNLLNAKIYEIFGVLDKFFQKARYGCLPSFSFLEPYLLSPLDSETTATSYHPPSDVASGEKFVKDIYDALSSSKVWEHTLFIITFDEHGGTYDHISQPAAIPPWGNNSAPPNGVTLECDFKFNRFGVRVPTIFVSPMIKPNVTSSGNQN